MFLKIIKILFLIIIPTILYAEEANKKTIVNKLTDPITNTFQSLTSFDGIKKAELEIDTKDTDFQPDIRASIVSSLSESNDKKTFWLNQLNLSNQDDRETINLGLMYRTLSDDNKWIRGFNIFYDHEFPYDHQRASVGIELKSSPIEFNSNYYQRLSGDKTIGSTTERAMDGMDAEIGFQVPYMPSSKLFFKGYEWDGLDYDVKSGNKISLRIRPTQNLEIELGADDNDQRSDYRATASIKFKKTFGEVKETSKLFISDTAFEYHDMNSEIYDTVRRQNRIVKTVTGTVAVARGT